MQIIGAEDVTTTDSPEPVVLRLRWYHWLIVAIALTAFILGIIFVPRGQSMMGHGVPPLPRATASQADIVVNRDLWDRMPAPIAENVHTCPDNAAVLPAMDESGTYNLSKLKVCLHGLWKFTLTDGATIKPAYNGVPASMSLVTITADGRTDYTVAYRLADDYKLFTILMHDDTSGNDVSWYDGKSTLNPAHHYTFLIAAYMPGHMDNASHFQEEVDWAAHMQQAAMYRTR